MPVIKAMLEGFPFTISGFRADHGSEYINHRVARLLEKLHIELTMSRRAIRMTTAWRIPRTAPWCTSASATAIPAALCDANQCLLRRIPQPFAQLPPALPVRRGYH